MRYYETSREILLTGKQRTSIEMAFTTSVDDPVIGICLSLGKPRLLGSINSVLESNTNNRSSHCWQATVNKLSQHDSNDFI